MQAKLLRRSVVGTITGGMIVMDAFAVASPPFFLSSYRP
jgi:hypothetical protein